MKFCLIFHRNYFIKNKSSLQILLIIQFVSCTMGKCFEGILAFLTLMVGESRCGKRVTDGVGEVLTGMMGSNMRHLVKVLLQLENLAQVKFQKKGFVITIIHCYGNKEFSIWEPQIRHRCLVPTFMYLHSNSTQILALKKTGFFTFSDSKNFFSKKIL